MMFSRGVIMALCSADRGIVLKLDNHYNNVHVLIDI